MAAALPAETSEPAPARPGRFRLPRALPQLGPRALLAFTILWLLVLPLALAAPVIGSYLDFQRTAAPVWRPLGVMMVGGDDSLRIIHVTSREARVSGLRPGDRVVAIDGRPVLARHSQEVRDWVRRPEGGTVALTVSTASGAPRTVALTSRASHNDEFYEGTGLGWRSDTILRLIPNLLAVLALVTASILLFRRRQDRVAALLSLSLLLIAANQFGPTFWAIYLPDVDRWVSVIGWSGLVLVLLVFPSGEFRPRWTLVPALLLIPWTLVAGARLLIVTTENVGMLLLLGSGVLALAARYRKLPDGRERQQLRWVFLGFAGGTAWIAAVMALVATFDSLAAWDGRFLVWLPIAFDFMLAAAIVSYVAGLLVSMLRFRLYDVDTAISRSAGYAILTLGFVAVFAASEKVLEIVSERYFEGTAGAVSGALAAAFAALLIPPMHNRVHAWAERRFRKALLHLRRDLPECVGDLRETAALKDLLDEVLARVETGTRAIRSAVVIDGRTAAARGDGGGDFPLSIPLRIGHLEREVGALLVGPRPDGSPLGKDEREALHDIADPVARAVQIASLREKRDETLAKALARLSRRLTALEKSSAEGGMRRGAR